MGDSIYANPMLLGYAWQKGWVPLGRAALVRAIELNGVAVDSNKAAFEWGRRAAHDGPALEKLVDAQGGQTRAGSGAQVIEFKKRDTLDGMVARRVEFLTSYQHAAYAGRYASFVEKVRLAEMPLGGTALTEAVARSLFKLMAYKDEYEVARLHTQTGFQQRIAAMFEGDYKINFHLAPPAIAPRNEKGELQKRKFGPWMLVAFRVLAKLKRLRGTPLDVFGRTAERRAERALIGEYRAGIEQLLPSLDTDDYALALEIARIPEQIKGFGHVKERNLAAARLQWARLMGQWESRPRRQAA
jgi:indolepyruvate ferredoxin oxidoreductase